MAPEIVTVVAAVIAGVVAVIAIVKFGFSDRVARIEVTLDKHAANSQAEFSELRRELAAMSERLVRMETRFMRGGEAMR